MKSGLVLEGVFALELNEILGVLCTMCKRVNVRGISQGVRGLAEGGTKG